MKDCLWMWCPDTFQTLWFEMFSYERKIHTGFIGSMVCSVTCSLAMCFAGCCGTYVCTVVYNSVWFMCFNTFARETTRCTNYAVYKLRSVQTTRCTKSACNLCVRLVAQRVYNTCNYYWCEKVTFGGGVIGFFMLAEVKLMFWNFGNDEE